MERRKPLAPLEVRFIDGRTAWRLKDEIVARGVAWLESPEDGVGAFVDNDVTPAAAGLRAAVLAEHPAPADPNPAVLAIHVTPAERDRLGGARARPEAKVHKRVVLVAFPQKPSADPLPLLIGIGVDLGRVSPLIEARDETRIEESSEVTRTIPRELGISEHASQPAVNYSVDRPRGEPLSRPTAGSCSRRKRGARFPRGNHRK